MKTIILCTIFLLVGQICVAKKEVNFIRLAVCPEYKNYTAFYRNVVFTRDKTGKSVAIRLDAVFKEEVRRLMIVVTLRKCASSENLDSCEYYMKDYKINNICDIIGKKNQLWSEVVANSNFPRSCPIAAGTYKINDSKLDGDFQLTLLPIPTAFWKIRFFAYDSENNNIMLSCTNLDVKVYHSRRYS